eukprot:scaffold68227_cov78-Phaeocystis_antarctica.AAC.1
MHASAQVERGKRPGLVQGQGENEGGALGDWGLVWKRIKGCGSPRSSVLLGVHCAYTALPLRGHGALGAARLSVGGWLGLDGKGRVEQDRLEGVHIGAVWSVGSGLRVGATRWIWCQDQ